MTCCGSGARRSSTTRSPICSRAAASRSSTSRTCSAEALKDPEARKWVLDRAVTPFTVGAGHVRRDPRLPRRGRRDDPGRPPDRRPDRARGVRRCSTTRHPDDRRRADRAALTGRVRHGRGRLHPAPAAQQLLHARPLGLALRRRRRQPHVLAGPPARGPQRRGDLPLPPACSRTPTSSSGTRGSRKASRSAARAREGGDIMPIGNRTVAHRHERAHHRPDDREDRAVAVRCGRRRPRDRRGHVQATARTCTSTPCSRSSTATA